MNNENYLTNEIHIIEDNLADLENYLVLKGMEDKLEQVKKIKESLEEIKN